MRTILTLILAALLQTYPAPGPGRQSTVAVTPITYTGNNCGAAGTGTGVSSETCTLTVANTGDTLVAFWSANVSSYTYSSSTISCGTGYVPTDRNFTWSSWRTFMVVVPNATAGSCSFKITVTGNMTYIGMGVLDFANANTSTPVDNASCTTSPYCQNSATGTSWATNSITTANANEMLVSYAASGYAPSSLTENNGFTAVTTTGGPTVYYKYVPSTGSYSNSWTAGSSGSWGAMITALKH